MFTQNSNFQGKWRQLQTTKIFFVNKCVDEMDGHPIRKCCHLKYFLFPATGPDAEQLAF